jgi:hypothetical protein
MQTITQLRIALSIVGVFLVFAGVVWFLQGMNILLGSPMSGHIQWSVWGGLTAIAGAALLPYANKRTVGRIGRP